MPLQLGEVAYGLCWKLGRARDSPEGEWFAFAHEEQNLWSKLYNEAQLKKTEDKGIAWGRDWGRAGE